MQQDHERDLFAFPQRKLYFYEINFFRVVGNKNCYGCCSGGWACLGKNKYCIYKHCICPEMSRPSINDHNSFWCQRTLEKGGREDVVLHLKMGRNFEKSHLENRSMYECMWWNYKISSNITAHIALEYINNTARISQYPAPKCSETPFCDKSLRARWVQHIDLPFNF